MAKQADASPVLLVEDRPSLARCYTEFLQKEKCLTRVASSGEEAMQIIRSDAPPALVIVDLQIADMDGIQLLENIQTIHSPPATIAITSNSSYETSQRVIGLGAIDYLEKPFTRDRLCVTVRNALKQYELERAVTPYSSGFNGFIGSSMVMQSVYRIIENAASSKASVFITGESGTGKEVCAQAIHNLSNRKDKPCVILNCAAIPKDLMESEIFGHVKGAFTGATGNRDGAASRADGGTLFLDEIGEMDLKLQSKLLRFIQTGQLQKVGSNDIETVDVRFVCATNRNPLEQVQAGTFREDLYYRLNVIPVHIPALRERGNDILSIASHFLKIFATEEQKSLCRFHPDTKDILLSYEWPGNVRQLLNVIRNIVVLNDGQEVSPAMLPAPFNQREDFATPLCREQGDGQPIGCEPATNGNSPPQPQATTIADIKPLWQVEMETIESAITLCEGNISHAAKLLEISPSTIYRKKPGWRKAGQQNLRPDAF